MHFKIKNLVFCLFVVSAQANDINETKIFLDKYLPKSKISKYKNQSTYKAYDEKISTIKDMKQTDKDTNSSASETVKNLYKDKAVYNEAKKIKTYVNSKEYSEKLQKAKDDILYDKKTNWQQYVPNNLKTGDNRLKIDTIFGSEKIFIIISSSIPDITLKNYLISLSPLSTKVTFVLRGVIGSHKKIMPTLYWIKDLLGDKFQYNIMIDPRITKKYNITKIPAILYIKDYNLDMEKHWIYYGDISIKYALEKINEDAKSEFLDDIVANIN